MFFRFVEHELPRVVKDLLEENLTRPLKKKNKKAPPRIAKMHRSEAKLRKNASRTTDKFDDKDDHPEATKKKSLTLAEQIANGFEHVK